MGWLSSGTSGRRPALTDVPPLAPATRTSVIVTPVAIALAAIRDATEQAAPRDLTGKRENPLTQLLSNAEIGWTVARGPLVVTGRPDALVLSSTLNGTFRATGQISSLSDGITHVQRLSTGTLASHSTRHDYLSRAASGPNSGPHAFEPVHRRPRLLIVVSVHHPPTMTFVTRTVGTL